MKKLIIGFSVMVFTMITTTSAFAGPHHRYPRSGKNHHVALMGLGLFTAAIVASTLSRPPVYKIKVQQAPACVPLYRKPMHVAPPCSEPPFPANDGQHVSVAPERLNVRIRPDCEAQVIAVSQQGTRLKIYGRAPGWLYVKLPSGQFGWVMAEYTCPLFPPAKG